MGYTTDFIGHIDVTPALNDEEIAYLTAFSDSRRFSRDGGPYEVPGNPAAEERGDVDIDRYNSFAPGQPGLWCQWVPCWDGCCLAFSGHERFYDPTAWLRYLIAHFLKPGAQASRRPDPRFAAFTFDHICEGMVVGCRRDDKELFAIEVRSNRVRERILRPADQRYLDRPQLPYERLADEWRAERPSRRRRRDDTALVVELDSRRRETRVNRR